MLQFPSQAAVDIIAGMSSKELVESREELSDFLGCRGKSARLLQRQVIHLWFMDIPIMYIGYSYNVHWFPIEFKNI